MPGALVRRTRAVAVQAEDGEHDDRGNDEKGLLHRCMALDVERDAIGVPAAARPVARRRQVRAMMVPHRSDRLFRSQYGPVSSPACASGSVMVAKRSGVVSHPRGAGFRRRARLRPSPAPCHDRPARARRCSPSRPRATTRPRPCGPAAGSRRASSRGSSVHEAFGGVVPELASRAHEQLIVPTVEAALAEAGLGLDDIGAVAVTVGPGLAGSLLVGMGVAKGIALGRGLPLVGVHHLDGHAASVYVSGEGPPLPFLCLTVSGGHTHLVGRRRGPAADRPGAHARRRRGRGVRQGRAAARAALPRRPARGPPRGRGRRGLSAPALAAAGRQARRAPALRRLVLGPQDGRPLLAGRPPGRRGRARRRRLRELPGARSSTRSSGRSREAARRDGHPRRRHRRRRLGQPRPPRGRAAPRPRRTAGRSTSPRPASRSTTPP